MRNGILRRGVTAAICGFLLLTAAAAAEGVTVRTASVGGQSASIVQVAMQPGRGLVPAVAGNSVHTDTPANELIQTVPGGQTVAALNGGFFNSYYQPGEMSMMTRNCPEMFNTVISEGRLICGGGETPAIGMTWDGKLLAAKVKLAPVVTLQGSVQVWGWSTNRPFTDSSAVYFLTPEMDYPLDIPAESHIVTVSGGKVTAVEPGRNGFVTPDGCFVLIYNSGAWQDAAQWNQEPVVGDSAVNGFQATLLEGAGSDSDWNNMRSVIGGGGVLVLNGKNAVDSNVDVAADQNPDLVSQRSFAAQTADGQLLLGTVSSSFRSIADSLVQMGVQNAVYMDGGASCMLYANGSFLTPAGRKLATALAVVDGLPAASAPAVSQPAEETPSAWAAESVAWARNREILPPELDGRYQRSITRREFCDLIAKFFRTEGGTSIEYYCTLNNISVNQNAFTDTNAYYVPYVAAVGIVKGRGNGVFAPDDSIQRQDAAIMLERLASLMDKKLPGGNGKSFTDGGSISGYAKSGVDFVTANGIMNGLADGSFQPRSNITREQALVTLRNMAKQLGTS